MNDYEARQEAKRARLERAAERAKAESAASFARARSYTEGIPFGQPILVGHHSEKRHRGALKRQDGAMRKACELSDKAAEYASRAASVGTGGISSDDPDAVQKLREKLADMTATRDRMKAANAAYRKRDDAALAALGHPTSAQYDEALKTVWSGDRKPHASYELTNLGARIRDTEKRIEELSSRDTLAEEIIEQHGENFVSIDEAGNRVGVKFARRLSKIDYKSVRSHGFVWSPTRSAFVRKFSSGAAHWARVLAGTLPSDAPPALPTPTPLYDHDEAEISDDRE